MSNLVTFVVVTTVFELLLSVDRGYCAPYETTKNYEVCFMDVCKERAALLKASINESVEPCDDFYSFVCDGWIANHTIPPDAESYGQFEDTNERVLYELKDLIENITNVTEPYSLTEKAAIVYQTCMEDNFTEFQKVALWGDMLAEEGFKRWPIADSKNVLYKTYRELLVNTSLWPIYYIAVEKDLVDKSKYIIELDQMPFVVLGREQLVNHNASRYSREVAERYTYLIATAILTLNPVATITESMAAAKQIFSFESELAKLTAPSYRTKNIRDRYNKTTFANLEKELPDLPILDSLNREFSVANITIAKSEELVMFAMEYFKATVQFLNNQSLAAIYNFVAWRRACDLGLLTSRRFGRAYQELLAIALGVQRPKPRWRYCLGKVSGRMPFVVGKLYVQKNFDIEAKKDVEVMVTNITNTFTQSLCFDTWMDNTTRDAALLKLQKMENKIGFPDWIYEEEYIESRFRFLEAISPSEPFASIMKKYSINSAILKMLNLRSAPSKNTTWLNPTIVNAFYSPADNQMEFPAGILRDVFYRRGLPASVNYGSIGSVIGHEMIHGFDDEGSQYDEEGRLMNWWTTRTREMFEDRAKCFVDQYSSEFSYLANRTLNGVNTLGENIADNGGFRMAFRTLSAQLKESITPDIRLPGLEKYTPRQLFFISNAMIWCGSVRKEALELYIEYDPHAPRRHRVNVSLKNMKSFSKAFKCREDQRMHYKKNETCIMW